MNLRSVWAKLSLRPAWLDAVSKVKNKQTNKQTKVLVERVVNGMQLIGRGLRFSPPTHTNHTG